MYQKLVRVVKKIAPYTEVTDHIISKHDIFKKKNGNIKNIFPHLV